MSKGPQNENTSAPPRDLLREARRLARLRRFQVVTNDSRVAHVARDDDTYRGPKDAA
jgi:hypothetical protein